MPIRNQHFYDANGAGPYPVSDAATCLDDDGKRLPPNVIVDLQLKWPDTLGSYAFISGVTVTEHVVAVVIQSATAQDAAGAFAPLAVITLPQPVAQGRVHTLSGQVPGIAGWIVFGDGVQDTAYRGRFSGPGQSLLVQRAARSYRALPVESMSVEDAATPLTGIVDLIATSPLELVREDRVIDGVLRDVIVLRLTDSEASDGVTVATPSAPADNLFKLFAGPCAGRPESQTCGDPEPIEFINAVGPDCDGVITIEFTGCAKIAKIADGCGVIVECNRSLTDACLAEHIPDDDGTLPNDKQPADIPVPEAPPDEEEEGGVSESVSDMGGLPYTDCFTDFTAVDFVEISGAWTFVADNSPAALCETEGTPVSASFGEFNSASLSMSINAASYASNSAADRNVTLWEGFDVATVFRAVETDLKMTAGPAGAKHNAGLVLNYRPHEITTGQYEYFVAELDYDAQVLRLGRFNGATLVTVGTVAVLGVGLDKWYRLTATVRPGPTPSQTVITAEVRSLDAAAVTAVLTITTNQYRPSTGWFGLHAHRALSYFSYFHVGLDA